MILSCPTCATRYFVSETTLGPEGRKVRCAACGAAWTAVPEPEPIELAQPTEPDPEIMAVESEAEAERPRPAAEAVSRAYRQKVEAQRKIRRAVTAGVIWGSLAASVAVFAFCAVVFRVQAVRLWPRTAGVYAALRLPVNPIGLSPENVQASPGLQDGHAALVVTGLERNVEAQPRPAALLRVSVYDKSGQRLASGIARPAPGPIAPGEARPFSISFLDPPMAGAQVGVDFVFERRQPKPRPAAAPVRLDVVRTVAMGPEVRSRHRSAPALKLRVAARAATGKRSSQHAKNARSAGPPHLRGLETVRLPVPVRGASRIAAGSQPPALRGEG